MFDNEKNFEEIIKGLKIDVEPNDEHRRNLRQQMMSVFNRKEQSRDQGGWQSFGRKIMKSKMTKLAAAAVIIFAVFIGINYFGGSVDMAGVAWGEVLKKVEQFGTFKFSQHWTMKGASGVPEGTIVEMDSTVYVSSEYGLRQDKFVNGMAVSRDYVPPAGTVITSLLPHVKKYIKTTMTEEQIREIHEKVNPKEMIREFMSYEHTELGREMIDGVEAEGIEVDDPKFASFLFESAKGRLWVGVRTELPVRIEMEGTSSAGVVETKIASFDFDWDVELGSEIFEPDIPDDYELYGQIDVSSNEEAAIKGLHMISEFVGGQYPASLDIMSASREAGAAFQAVMADEPDRDPNMPLSKEELEKIGGIQAACRFYGKLVEDEMDAAYYGEKVAPENFGMVLLRWKISDEKYRVIFADLTVEDVSVERLSELENDPDFIRVMAEPRKIAPYQIASDFLGQQTDRWLVGAENEITVHSLITIIRWPQEATIIEIRLPYTAGLVESATFGEEQIQYELIEDGRYELELPENWELESEKSVEVVWKLSLDSLNKVDDGYRVKLKSLIPVTSYKLSVVLEADCGFEYTEDPNQREFTPFSWNSTTPKTYFGDCGIMIQQSN